MHHRLTLLAALLCLTLAPAAAHADGPPQPGDPLFDPVTERGQNARGLYLGANFVDQNGAQAVVDAVQRARMNAVVIDLKDAEGRVHHDTAIPELETAETGWLGDAAGLIRTLHENDIYVIARITCFADRRLPAIAMDRAIRHVRPARDPWVSWGTGGTWLDPYHPQNQAMVVSLAEEAEALGFDEIQLDYVRFPVDDGTRYARYPSETDETRPEVLLRMLRSVDEAINIPLGVDVFGLAAYRRGDPSGLGQDLEAWAQYVEVYTPMLYINSMRSWRLGERDRTFRLVYGGIQRLRARLGEASVIRPFLQAFERGSGVEEFGPDFIHDQVRAVRRGHGDGFLFWHPGHTYGVVRRAMRGRTRSLVPFPRADELTRRRSGEIGETIDARP
ncbi:MAG: putative glycoside hydrolase [Sandaracinaceae bacterium]